MAVGLRTDEGGSTILRLDKIGRRSEASRPVRVSSVKTPRINTAVVRRGGRVVECDGLENRYTGNRIECSNPSLSAIN